MRDVSGVLHVWQSRKTATRKVGGSLVGSRCSEVAEVQL